MSIATSVGPVGFLVLVCCHASMGFGQNLHLAEDGASDRSGLFAYKTSQGGVFTLNAVFCESGHTQLLFTKTVTNEYVQSPLCFSNAIVAVTSKGKIVKYDLAGNEVFEKVMLETNEVSNLSGRWNANSIYVIIARYEGNPPNRTMKYRIEWIDVSAKSPVRLAEATCSSVVSEPTTTEVEQ